ncbi:MOSC domain-containing protein [Limobrevibacterium gyesilva]|uniref:MOSC domain-containing protein n=1 Tax=Limobrevibacterium gyesilva TaxID=2991712 RepID=A0AA42CGE8_9PROT|nr:MOSC N-terminal beta barrel domain-containing protein [Limobrevibacterium gyesilva]MCW3475966.1 MOSC domain-containing protein [Limobrevibacterium gyesilva]
MRIDRIYRYPVKGLTAEALEEVAVEPGCALPWDRAFALAQGDAPFDPAEPKWLPKTNFMCLRQNATIARLKASFDARHGKLTITAPDGSRIEEIALDEPGRARIGAWLTAYLGAEARGAPRFHHVPGHVFGDQRTPVISLINQASIADLEQHVGVRRHRRRFRANIYFSGAPAWSEFGWVGQELIIGSARLRVLKRITRCPATEVNPDTGLRDANPIAELKATFGHADLGVLAEVVEGGRMALGDSIELLPA